jgi:DedD protein
MTKTKEYRELQYTSSQLAAVLIGILAIGIVIFGLGVSVGKKQGRLAAAAVQPVPAKSESIAEAKPQPVEEKTAAGTPSPKAPPASASKTPETKPGEAGPPAAKKAEPKPAAGKPIPTPAKTGSYFVQASATNDKVAATAFARRLENEGFNVVVLDPFPTDVKTYYRVRVGPFASKEEAEAARTKLATVLRKRPTDFFLIRA